MMKYLLATAFFIFATAQAMAADRSQLVQSRIQSTLSGMLSKNDYVVIVNKVEALDSSVQNLPATNLVKTLPGLNLGIDAAGKIVNQGGESSGYYGGVSVQIIVDEAINPKTYQLIESLLPEMMGGVQDEDEFRVSRGKLRQVPVAQPNNQPTVNVNNSMASPANDMRDNLKFLALALVILGGMLWMFSRQRSPQDGRRRDDGPEARPLTPQDKLQAELSVIDYAILDAEAVSLFLLRELKNRKYESYIVWKNACSAKFKREVFKHYPAWIVSFIQNAPELNTEVQTNAFDAENAAAAKNEENQKLFEQMTLFEQVMRESKNRHIFFLKYFPAAALRFVPKSELAGISGRAKKTIWLLRQDLGGLTSLSAEELNSLSGRTSDEDIAFTRNEFFAFNMRDFITEENTLDMSALFKTQILALREFSAISSKLSEAQLVLSPEEFENLRRTVGHVELPFLFDSSQIKQWLKNVEPEDYFWWLSLVKKPATWNLADHLRPIRLEMFRQSEQALNFRQWSEDQKKRSSEKLLLSLVRVLQQDQAYDFKAD